MSNDVKISASSDESTPQRIKQKNVKSLRMGAKITIKKLTRKPKLEKDKKEMKHQYFSIEQHLKKKHRMAIKESKKKFELVFELF